MLPDCSIGSGLYLQYGGVFLSSSLYFMAICWRNKFASWLRLPRYACQIMTCTQLLHIRLLRPLYHFFCICRSLPLLNSDSRNLWFWSPGLGWRPRNI
jgi:hypothetical protein